MSSIQLEDGSAGMQPSSPTRSSTSWANVISERHEPEKKAAELLETNIYDAVDASGIGPAQWLRDELNTVDEKLFCPMAG